MSQLITHLRSVAVTHLRSNHAWRARWASLALESLCVIVKKKKIRKILQPTLQNTIRQCSDYVTYSLSSLSRMSRQSVFPCRSLKYTHKSVSVTLQNDKRKWHKGFMYRVLCSVCVCLDLQEGPLVLGILLVPEGLEDPEKASDCW